MGNTPQSGETLNTQTTKATRIGDILQATPRERLETLTQTRPPFKWIVTGDHEWIEAPYNEVKHLMDHFEHYSYITYSEPMNKVMVYMEGDVHAKIYLHDQVDQDDYRERWTNGEIVKVDRLEDYLEVIDKNDWRIKTDPVSLSNYANWSDGCDKPGEPTDRTVIPDGREHGISNKRPDSSSVGISNAGGWLSKSTIDPADHQTYEKQVTVTMGNMSFAEFFSGDQVSAGARAERVAAIYSWLMGLQAPGLNRGLPGIGNERRLDHKKLQELPANETRIELANLSKPGSVGNWVVTAYINQDGFSKNFGSDGQGARYAAARYKAVAGIEKPGADFWDAVR